MGLKYRGGRAYYYRSRRVGDRVVTEYVGGGELAKLLATADAHDARTAELERRSDDAAIERAAAEERGFVA